MNAAIVSLVLFLPPAKAETVKTEAGAQRVYRAAIVQANIDHAKALEAAYEHYVDNLKLLQQAALKAKDVKAVVRLQKAIDSAEKPEKPKQAIPTRASVIKRRWARHAVGIENALIVQFRSNGTIQIAKDSPRQGSSAIRWTYADGLLTLFTAKPGTRGVQFRAISPDVFVAVGGGKIRHVWCAMP